MFILLLALMGSSLVGGAAVWGGTALRERLKARAYLRWRAQWHLLKGGADDGRS